MSTGTLTRTIARPVEAYAGAAFVYAFTVCLLLMSLPIKNFGYIVPPVFFGLQLFADNIRFVKQTLLWMCLAICASTLSILFDSLSAQSINLPGLAMAVVTYFPLFIMLGSRSCFRIGAEAKRNLIAVVAWWLIVQSVIGLIQFALTRSSDAVCGTMGLLEFYTGTITITQVYFTFNLFAMTLFLFTDYRRLVTKVAIALSMLTCAVAHSGHQTMFMMAALAFVAAFQMSPKILLRVGAVLALLVTLVASVSEIYMEEVSFWAEYTFREDAPRRMAMRGAEEILSSPKNMILGAGMGQFASRAALISSGEHVSAQLPPWLLGRSDYYRMHLRPAHEVYMRDGQGSAMSKPYSSALNFVVEFGLPATLLALTGLGIAFLNNQRLAKSANAHLRLLGMLSNVGIVFFVLCCFIENYLEFPQAIFLPLLLYIAVQASVASVEAPRRSVSARG
jgi:hypothetical protein